MTFGQRVAAKRAEKGWSQRELGRQAGVPHTTIAELERGIRQAVSTDVARKLARALHVGVDYLLATWEDEESDLLTAVAS